MRIEKDGHEIRSIHDWHEHAPPKRADQWVEGRSAYELARAWCGSGEPAMPQELRELLDSRPETTGMTVDCVYPEHAIRFDKRAEEPRNADLAFVGHVGDRSVAVTVEAKADEPFGSTVAETICDALERRVEKPRSQGVERVTDLVTALLPPHAQSLPHVGELYYQLLTATAGTLAYAIEHSVSLAALVIHEFVTGETDDSLHARNAAAYGDFIARLCERPVMDEKPGGLTGPFAMHGVPLFQQPPNLVIGKITTNCRNALD